MINIRNISKTYGKFTAVNCLNLEIKKGELIALVGESGCGKTTTLKMINRLIERTSGSVEIEGRDISHLELPTLRRGIGYVFQGVGLFPHYNIQENIAVVPKLLGWSPSKIEARVIFLLNLLHLPADTFRFRYPKELSGGQRQRVGLARALAAEPPIMLMDEPFGAIDPINRDHLQVEFRKIHDDNNLTTVMVTHDMMEALLIADRIAIMYRGELIQVGRPTELLNQPTHEYVRSLIATPLRQASVLAKLSKHLEGQDRND